MVPSAEFRSYYGRPVVKAPVWRHDIAAYLFTGGLAAGSALLAAGADLTGRRGLRRAGRVAALGALGASTYFLINDLGRPEDVANAALYLASDESRFVMASGLIIDGGVTGAK